MGQKESNQTNKQNCMCICRNYLDYVEESVADWTKEEEAKYQAHLLSKEIQRMREEEEMASRAAEKRQKSGKRGSSKSIIWASSRKTCLRGFRQSETQTSLLSY